MVKVDTARSVAILLVFSLLISFAGDIYKKQLARAGTPGDVIISEIMYNPGTGNQNDEFLELYNTQSSPIVSFYHVKRSRNDLR